MPLLAFFEIALHLATASRYGIFRDELYYIACARHLAWGYVDQPPLIAFVTWVALHAFGTSLIGLRLFPALAGGLLVFITAGCARELGGGRWAQGIAALAVVCAPVFLMMLHWLTMNAFEPLLWTTTFWLALRMMRRQDPRYWLPLGLVCGIGLENKYSMLLPAVALVGGMLVTKPGRRSIATPWFAAGVALAFLLFLPNLLWLLHHGFPFLEFERNSRLSASRILRSPVAFIADQLVLMNALSAPLWLCGLGALLLAPGNRGTRFLGWAALGIFLLLLALQAKDYYVAPLYPLLFAAGGVALEHATQTRGRPLRSVYPAALAAAGLLLAPFALPVLPVRSFLAYQHPLGFLEPIHMERLPLEPLPQQFADEFGWLPMVAKTAAVYSRLPASERQETAIFANNYGEAGAVDFFGPRYGLPPAISKHESYWLWGPRGYTGGSVIVLGSDGKGDRAHFRSVEAVAQVDDPYARPDEHFDIFLCRGLSSNLRTLWPSMKTW